MNISFISSEWSSFDIERKKEKREKGGSVYLPRRSHVRAMRGKINRPKLLKEISGSCGGYLVQQTARAAERGMDKRNWLLDESSRFRNVYWYRLVAYESWPALTRINFLGWSMLIDNTPLPPSVLAGWSIELSFRFRLILITWRWIRGGKAWGGGTRDR